MSLYFLLLFMSLVILFKGSGDCETQNLLKQISFPILIGALILISWELFEISDKIQNDTKIFANILQSKSNIGIFFNNILLFLLSLLFFHLEGIIAIILLYQHYRFLKYKNCNSSKFNLFYVGLGILGFIKFCAFMAHWQVT